jgi:hypothetical protein
MMTADELRPDRDYQLDEYRSDLNPTQYQLHCTRCVYSTSKDYSYGAVIGFMAVHYTQCHSHP